MTCRGWQGLTGVEALVVGTLVLGDAFTWRPRGYLVTRWYAGMAGR